jgi:hypothetical protein
VTTGKLPVAAAAASAMVTVTVSRQMAYHAGSSILNHTVSDTDTDKPTWLTQSFSCHIASAATFTLASLLPARIPGKASLRPAKILGNGEPEPESHQKCSTGTGTVLQSP